MKKLYPLIALTLALTFTTSSIYGQDPYYQEDENHSSAYADGSHSAHWSVYIPITILVGAAIWFGLADGSDSSSSSNSQDGLGSLANSKRMSHRQSSRRSDWSPPYKRHCRSSHGSYSH